MKSAAWLAPVCLLVIFFVSAPADSATQTVTSPTGKTVRIEILQPKDAFAMIQKNKNNADFVLIDVRTPEEFDGGHIAGAVNVDYNSGNFRGNLHELDRKKTYLVYCRTGRRSAAAVELMVELGFANISRLAGDIVRWKSEGFPLVK